MKNFETFKHVINPNKNFTELKQEILNKDAVFFTFDYKYDISKPDNKISAENFWKVAQIKSKNASLFVDEILSCDFAESAPLGFVREITMSGSDAMQAKSTELSRIKERVVIDEETKTALFFQLETNGKILLNATNQVVEENNNVYFFGHYVYNVLKNSQESDDIAFMKNLSQQFLSRMDVMIDKMKLFATSKELEKTYQQLFG
ncbi:MAG: hypothetical protein A3E82_09820 [Gammaproteobacteria bacterium RIFCSPHIGHO2_12_FULL_38_11]|nr:MAG: hypothetical protein A3E82_09820 [Gammaproteobacteria bacterium RIFCSPHIGHO2_12_FULL_38_11]